MKHTKLNEGVRLPYEVPEVKLYLIPSPLSLLASFSAESGFVDWDEDDEL